MLEDSVPVEEGIVTLTRRRGSYTLKREGGSDRLRFREDIGGEMIWTDFAPKKGVPGVGGAFCDLKDPRSHPHVLFERVIVGYLGEANVEKPIIRREMDLWTHVGRAPIGSGRSPIPHMDQTSNKSRVIRLKGDFGGRKGPRGTTLFPQFSIELVYCSHFRGGESTGIKRHQEVISSPLRFPASVAKHPTFLD